MMPTSLVRRAPALLFLVALIAPAFGATPPNIALTLRNDFIREYKNRATIDADLRVVIAAEHPHTVGSTSSDDGDLHVAVESDDVGLPMVAELMNARNFSDAVEALQDAEGGNALKATGVWRIWPEHAGEVEFIQDSAIPPYPHTNPPHVYEIHPIISVNSFDTRSSFADIEGYEGYKDSRVAYNAISKLDFWIEPGPSTTSMTMKSVGYNYIDMKVQLLEPVTHELGEAGAHGEVTHRDGYSFYGSWLTLSGNVLKRQVRFILVAGTPPEASIKKLSPGSVVHVVAMPRVDLALVVYRAGAGGQVLKWKMPYELVILAVLQ